MAQIKVLLIECGFCQTKFHSKAFAQTETLQAALAAGQTVNCPKCGKHITCTTGNTFYTLEDSAGAGAIDFA